MSLSQQKSLSMRQKAWDALSEKPMSISRLADIMNMPNYHMERRLNIMIRLGQVVQMRDGTLCAIGSRPTAADKATPKVPLEVKLRPNGMTPLSVPNSVWQMKHFV